MKSSTRSLLLLGAVFLLASAASATVTVTVSSPANNASVPTSFNVVASASTDAAGASVTGWYIYVDSVAAWNTSGPTSTINANLTLTTGTHTVLVRAWDSTGAFGSQSLSLTASACSGICVTVTSPTVTGSVPSPVRFTASAVDGASHPITGFVIYSDNTNVYQNHTSTEDTWVILPAGAHSIYIRAWDSTGAFGTSATFPINVSGTVIPTPLAGAITFGNVDDLTTGWGSCGTPSCAGGQNTATLTFDQDVSSPSRDGGSAHLSMSGGAFANALWWRKNGAQDSMTNYLWDFWFYLPSSNPTPQAIEFDLWQSTAISGTMKKFMFGSQCNVAKGIWQGWNETTTSWVDTSHACTGFSTDTWHHAIYFLQRVNDARDTLLYGSVTIDGATTQWNLQEPSATTTWGANTGEQWQLDLRSAGGTLQEYIDSVQVTMWPD